MKSKPYKFDGKLFRYDFDAGLVEYIGKADDDMLRDNEEWQAKHGRNLWDVDAEGYMVFDYIGLRKENWKNKAVRDEYLSEWCFELDEEASVMVDNFVKHELPYMNTAANKEEQT